MVQAQTAGMSYFHLWLTNEEFIVKTVFKDLVKSSHGAYVPYSYYPKHVACCKIRLFSNHITILSIFRFVYKSCCNYRHDF